MQTWQPIESYSPFLVVRGTGDDLCVVKGFSDRKASQKQAKRLNSTTKTNPYRVIENDCTRI